MTKLEKLQHKAHIQGIHIDNFSFCQIKKAVCFYDPATGYKVILLDKAKIENTTEETQILAEEIGHYETNSLYCSQATTNMPSAKLTRTKSEIRAKKWAFEYMLLPNDIKRAIDEGHETKYELADELGVTECFLVDAIEYYKTKGEL